MNVAHIRQHRDATVIYGRITMIALLAVVLSLSAGRAQGQEDPHAGHRMTPSATTQPNAGDDTAGDAGAMAGMNMNEGMDMGAMQGGPAPPDARDPHAYAEGYDFGPYSLRMMDTHSLAALLVNNLEAVHGDDNTFMAYDLQAWYGRTFDRAVLKAEGDIDGGEVTDARTELLWGHAVAPYWDTQLGARYDSGAGPDRVWLAFGVQGLAPYWFEVDVTGYLRETGHSALRVDTEYELLLTQKLILQPRVEANAYGKSDAERGLGSGLSDITAGLRLRYEIRREFAPYVGVEWAGKFGQTKDLAQASGDDPSEMQFVAGLRFWF